MPRARSSRHQFPSPRRVTEWGNGPFSSAIQSVTAATNTLVDSGVESLVQQTIVRIRGNLMIWLPVITTIGDGFTAVTCGMGVVSKDAFDAGAGSIPSPSGDPDWPGWLWFASLGPMIGLTTTETQTGPLNAVRVAVDTKAMRKFGPNEVLMGIVSTSTEIGAATLSFGLDTRMLTKLS